MSSLSIEEKARIFLEAVEEARLTDEGITPEGLASLVLARHGAGVIGPVDAAPLIRFLNELQADAEAESEASPIAGVSADIAYLRRLIARYGPAQLKAIIDQLSS